MQTTTLHLAVTAAVLATGCSLLYGTDGFLGTDASQGRDAGLDAGQGDAGADAGCELMCDGECTDTQGDTMHCGACDQPCSAPDHGTARCIEGMCGFICEADYFPVLDECEPRAPRPIAPLSTSTVTSQTPTFRWDLGPHNDGARIEICADRACTTVLDTVDVSGSSGQPSSELPLGVVFWRLYGRQGGDVSAEPSVTWQIHIHAQTAPIDTSWGTTLDVNGDGMADLAVGAYALGAYRGRVYVYMGSTTTGISRDPVTLIGPDVAGSYFGESLTSAGDINGDGFADLAVGASGVSSTSSAGHVYVYLGGQEGVSEDPTPLVSPDGLGSLFGRSVAGVGDVDGDGYGDVVVGAPGANDGRGHAYLYLGSGGGLSSAPLVLAREGGKEIDEFGSAVAGAGDVNCDSYADIVIGAAGVASLTGAVYVYLGDAGGISSVPLAIEGPDGESGEFGISVAGAGDVNGDGCADIVVGASGAGFGAGRAYVYLGGPDALSTSPLTLGPEDGGGFGAAVASRIRSDGYSDLLIGAPNAGAGSGGFYVYAGGAGTFSTVPTEAFIYPAGEGGRAGYSVAGAGDLDGDMEPNFVVGIPGYDSDTGRVGFTGVDPAPFLTAPGGEGGEFGAAVAGAQ